MNCKEIKNLIPLFLDDELQSPEGKRVSDHVAGCAACQKELEAYKQSWAMLDQFKGVQPEPGYVGRFWTRISEEQPWQERIVQGVVRGTGPRFSRGWLAPAFVTACVLVIVGLFALRNYSQIQDTDQMLASLGDNEFEMIENIELAENFEFIEDMEFFEDLEIIESLDSLET